MMPAPTYTIEQVDDIVRDAVAEALDALATQFRADEQQHRRWAKESANAVAYGLAQDHNGKAIAYHWAARTATEHRDALYAEEDEAA